MKPKIQTWSIDKLKEWKNNPRTVSKEGFERLKKQIDELDIYKPLLIHKDGTVLGGNMRLRAFRKKGIKKVLVSVVDAPTEEEKIKYALSDNDQVGKTEKDQLLELIENYPDIKLENYAVHFDEPETLDLFIDQFQEIEEDEPPPVEEGEPISKYGEVYQLGRHRLMCGDATKKEDVEKLMDGKKADMVFTDPPYGVSYGDKNAFLNAIGRGNHIQENIDNDTKSIKEMKELWTESFKNMNTYTKAGGTYYGCSPQGGELMMMMMSWLEAGWELKQQIIWVKNNIVLGRSDYHYKHEPILYGWKIGKAHQFYGNRGENTVWEVNKPQQSKLHPTMKPIGLVARATKNSSKEEDIIMDLFGGSGSTLIACEQTNRICYMMEIDPKYCDVIRKRYENYKKNH